MTDPERATGGARILSSADASVMGALQAAQIVIVAAEHVRRPREQLKILRAERRGLIRTGQRLERLAPPACGVGQATSFQIGDRIRHLIIER